MKLSRRQMLFGLGATAGVSGGVLATGALTSIQTTRSIDVDVEGDSSAFLGLYDTSSGDFVTTNGGAIQIQLNDDTSGNGTGVNHGSNAGDIATTTLHPAFTIRNQGEDQLYVQIDHDGVTGSGNDVQFIGNDSAENSGTTNADQEAGDVITNANNLAFIDRGDTTAVTTSVHAGGTTTTINEGGYLDMAAGDAVDVILQIASDTTSTGDVISQASIIATGDSSNLSGSVITTA